MLVAGYLALWTVGEGVAASVPAHPALGSRTPADVGLRYREVTLRSADGVDLAAWWVPSRNRAAVALFHGSGSTRTAVLDQAAVLAERGYGVLLVDARGHGGRRPTRCRSSGPGFRPVERAVRWSAPDGC